MNMCMRAKVPATGKVRFSGTWSTKVSARKGMAQLSARYFGADGKWVSGKDAQRPVWIVENTKESLKDTDFDKTFVAPEAATMVHMCIILAGMEGMVELQDACIQSVP